jgi:hypothetical protein
MKSDRKIAMLHIKKQYERKYPITQLLRNANLTCRYQLDSKTMICSNGEFVSKGHRGLPSKEDSSRLPLGSLMSSPTCPLKWVSKLRCSIRIVHRFKWSLPIGRGVYIDFTCTCVGPTQSTGEIIIKMESSVNNGGGINERNFYAGRS